MGLSWLSAHHKLNAIHPSTACLIHFSVNTGSYLKARFRVTSIMYRDGFYAHWKWILKYAMMCSRMSGWRIVLHVCDAGKGICPAETIGGVRKANLATARLITHWMRAQGYQRGDHSETRVKVQGRQGQGQLPHRVEKLNSCRGFSAWAERELGRGGGGRD